SPAEHHGLGERVAGHAVRAVDAGRRALARREQARDRRSPLQIRRHAPQEVVRGRRDRHRLTRQVESPLAHRPGHVREPSLDLLAPELPRVEERPAPQPPRRPAPPRRAPRAHRPPAPPPRPPPPAAPRPAPPPPPPPPPPPAPQPDPHPHPRQPTGATAAVKPRQRPRRRKSSRQR